MHGNQHNHPMNIITSCISTYAPAHVHTDLKATTKAVACDITDTNTYLRAWLQSAAILGEGRWSL